MVAKRSDTAIPPTVAPLPHQVCVPIHSDADIILARQVGRNLATELHCSATDIAFIATAISELARNLFSHVDRGEVWLQAVRDNGRTGIEIVARDPGRGDDDLTDVGGKPRDLRVPDCLALDVWRLVDEFRVESGPDESSTITAVKWCR